jgi:GNAT superfamily N-acetyltransferase
MRFTFGIQVIDLAHEGLHNAIAYAVDEVGMVRASLRLDPWGLAKRPFLSAFSVDLPLRNQGVGTALLSFAMSKAVGFGIPSIAMWVHRDNVSAFRFYSRLGFEAFFEEGENIFYARRLDPSMQREPSEFASHFEESR